MKRRTIKSISLSLAFLMAFSILPISAFAAARNIDIAFVIDTTSSMEDDINAVQTDMGLYVQSLIDSGINYRIAIIDYRDFSERTGDSRDYPYSIKLDFTSDETAIQNGIDALSLGYGGDSNETIHSALIDGLGELSWRSSAGKAAVVMGDAPALEPEPITGYTYDDVMMALGGSIAVETSTYSKSSGAVKEAAIDEIGTVVLFTIATSEDSETIESFELYAEGTGGLTYVAPESSEVSGIVQEVIDVIPDVVEETGFLQRIISFFIMIFEWIMSIFM